MKQEKIQRKAREKVTEIFNKDIHDRMIRKTAEEINQVAQTEAMLFYQSRKRWLFPIRSVGREEHIRDAYTRTFSDTYTKFKKHYQATHPA
jgi:hypothetical protein